MLCARQKGALASVSLRGLRTLRGYACYSVAGSVGFLG